MVAAVIPIIRLPKRFGAFDYIVPPEFEIRLRHGSLVRIQFRKKEVYGLVWNTTRTVEKEAKLKAIAAVLHEKPLLLPPQLSLLKTVVDWYGISLAHAATLFMPPLQKKNISLLTLIDGKNQLTIGSVKPIYHHYQTPAEQRGCLNHAISGTTLILVPTVADIEPLASALSRAGHKKISIFHSNLTAKEQFVAWGKARNDEISLMVGTRGAIFLPFFKLNSILVDNEQDENHKHWDQAPRYQAKDMAHELAKLHRAQLHLMSYSPSFESYYKVYKKIYTLCSEAPPITRHSQWLKRKPEIALPRTIDLRDERRAKNYSLFSAAAMDAVSAADEDVFLFINRLGFATSVGCHDCGFILNCQNCKLPMVYHDSDRQLHCHYCKKMMDMIALCPKCESPAVQLRGAGTELVEKETRRLLANNPTHDIIRIDRDSSSLSPRTDKPAVIIGTEMALPHIRWDHTSVIIFLDMDKQLGLPEYSATESAWHTLQRVEYQRRKNSVFLLQTFHPEHPLFRSLIEPDRIYRTELSARKTLLYPPYTYITRYLYGHASPQLAEREATLGYGSLQRMLTDAPSKAILLSPIETQPKFFRGKYWYTLIIKLPTDSWREILPELNLAMPDLWKIDPNPINILQP